MATRTTPFGTTYTLPVAGDHPRIWLSNTSNFMGTRLSTIRDRITQSPWLSYWNSFQALVNNEVGKSNNNWLNEDGGGEFIAMFAFSWLLDPTKTNHAQKARDLAVFLSGQGIPSDNDQRKARALGLALTHDWLYNFGGYSASDKQAVRNAIQAHILAMEGILVSDGYIFGNGHEFLMVRAVLQPSVMEDASAGGIGLEGLRVKMDNILDGVFKPFENPSKYRENIFALERYSADAEPGGDRDGGSVRGSGSTGGYLIGNIYYYLQLYPAILTALKLNLYELEPWFMDQLHAVLWQWRGDRTFFRFGEHRSTGQYDRRYQQYALQVAAIADTALVTQNHRQHAMWLESEVDEVNNLSMQSSREFLIHQILFRPTGVSAIRPTVARYANSQMRVFNKVGHAALRTTWEPTNGIRLITFGRAKYIVGHVKKDGGHWALEVNGQTLLNNLSHRDNRQDLAYKKVGDSIETGHKKVWSFQHISHSGTVSIFHSGEKAANLVDSFRFRQSGSDQVFGYQETLNGPIPSSSNLNLIIDSGTQLWPKATGSNLAHTDKVNTPYDFADLLAEPEWNRQGMLSSPDCPKETSEFCYHGYHLNDHYWDEKCFKFRRHYLWVKTGVFTGWSFPVLMIWDDMQVRVDTTHLNKTVRYNLLGHSAPTLVEGNPNFTLRITRNSARVFHRTHLPDVIRTDINRFRIENSTGQLIEFVGTNAGSNDDAGNGSGTTVWRTEIYPQSSPSGGSTWDLSMLHVAFPCTTAEAAPPVTRLVNTATHIGIRIENMLALLSKDERNFRAVVQKSRARSRVLVGV